MITETEIFKFCLSNKTNLKILDRMVKPECGSVKEKIKYYVKLFMRVYNALTKFVKAQTDQGKTVIYNLSHPTNLSKSKETYVLKPTSFTSNLENEGTNEIKVNVGSIAQVCSIKTNVALFIVK